MIWFFTPYSFDKKMFEAWAQYMNLVGDEDDWVCMMDGDIAFLNANFGHHISDYINKYPDTGLFTCYASRSRTRWMMPDLHIFSSTNILDHKRKADKHVERFRLDVEEIHDRVTGHLMVIRKGTWLKIREMVSGKTVDKNILSVDSAISRSILEFDLKIRLMKGIYVFHYYRHLEGADYKGHLV